MVPNPTFFQGTRVHSIDLWGVEHTRWALLNKLGGGRSEAARNWKPHENPQMRATKKPEPTFHEILDG